MQLLFWAIRLMKKWIGIWNQKDQVPGTNKALMMKQTHVILLLFLIPNLEQTFSPNALEKILAWISSVIQK